ncbi:SIS domain-containing protein [Nonomuraea sp. NEAU-A123]|uniref:SIS domain-containing protein n=1 Tax=Nonomuraea sp. NEAU-A123 TaxID=2839649 RepID=UPI0020328C73|nr:SIS domain-containing protein [Nonomuraea sp. NEAU-A123]
MTHVLGTSLQERDAAGLALAEDAEPIARACQDVARRFQRGGRLLSFGTGQSAADAAHLAVEFVHPVIVGKRALPAVSLANDASALSGLAHAGVFASQLRLLGRAGDIAVGITIDEAGGEVAAGLAAAHDLGMMTLALTKTGVDLPVVDHLLVARSRDPLIAREIHMTTYHVLWELVHVFLNDPRLTEECPDEVCVTCSDAAVPVRITALRPGHLALADTPDGEEEISVRLVDVRAGDVVLVHAKEAIAVVERRP